MGYFALKVMSEKENMFSTVKLGHIRTQALETHMGKATGSVIWHKLCDLYRLSGDSLFSNHPPQSRFAL